MSNVYNVTVMRSEIIDYRVVAESQADAEMLAIGCATADKQTVSVKKQSGELTPWELDDIHEVKPATRGVVSAGTAVIVGPDGKLVPAGGQGDGFY